MRRNKPNWPETLSGNPFAVWPIESGAEAV
jgi:hypothetical protein